MALAIAAAATLAAAVPGQGRADVCAEYRAAIAIEEAASAASTNHARTRLSESWTDSREWRDKSDALWQAAEDAWAARGRAARTVHGSIEYESARKAIDALTESSFVLNAALHRFRDWPPWALYDYQPNRSFTAIANAMASISEAYREALLAACELGLAEAGE